MKPLFTTLALIVLAVTSAGCRAPMPSFRSSNLMSAFGSTRVPPPGTGSFVTASRYNDGAAQTPRSAVKSTGWRTATQTNAPLTTAQPAGDTRIVPSITSGTANRFTQSSGITTVQPARFATTSTTSSSSRAVGTGTSAIQLNGMHVNDATTRTPPAQFAAASNFSPVPRTAANTRVTAVSGSQGQASLNTSADSLGWRARSGQ